MKDEAKLKIGAVSMKSLPGNSEENVKNTISWIKKAKEQEIELLLFPELNITGYWNSRELISVAEPLNGKSINILLNEIAKIGGIVAAVGLAEEYSNSIFNTHILIGPEGVMGYYRKTHSPFPENFNWGVGNHFPIFKVGDFKVGIAICYDNSFPEVYRCYATQGCDIILSPYAFGFTPFKTGDIITEQKAIHDWKKSVSIDLQFAARANVVYSIACVGAGHIKDYRVEKGEPWPTRMKLDDLGPMEYFLSGGILIFGPDGKLIAESPNDEIGEYLVSTTITGKDLNNTRAFVYNTLKDRRPEIYSHLTKLP